MWGKFENKGIQKNTPFIFLIARPVYSQDFTQKQTRHRFAQHNLGLDFQSGLSATTLYLDVQKNMQTLYLANSYSLSFITFQFTGDPYEEGSQFLDNYIVVAKSWAEHIGVSFSGRFSPEDLTLRNGYVPEGLFHDLIDSGAEPDLTGVIDDVSGYTKATLFSRRGASTIPQLQASLLTLSPAGNTSASYTILFNSHGY